MKPQLERMVDMVVAALSGKARQFYDLEFDFFNEVTSISGKLKPYIKKSKPEKKVNLASVWIENSKINRRFARRLKSTRRCPKSKYPSGFTCRVILTG
jgi:hypothetical protein